MIAAKNLIDQFKHALNNGWGYIYGTSGAVWTQAEQDKATREQTKKWGQRWVGKHVADCSGLFVYAFKACGGSIYHGSNAIWSKYCSAQGTLKDGKKENGTSLLPGTAVFKTTGTDRHHIGLYIGDGVVIEAKGTYYGVVTSKVSIWDEWGELKDVAYSVAPVDPVAPGKGKAVVNAKAVALREAPTTNGKVLARLSTGTVVDLADPPSDWEYVQSGNLKGYMMTKFLTKGG